jgi:hypothetical protein
VRDVYTPGVARVSLAPWAEFAELAARFTMIGRKFIDMGDRRTHRWLTERLPALLVDLHEERFSRRVLMTDNRRITRIIAGHLHSHGDEIHAHPIMGLRYERKIGDQECWAIWKRGAKVRRLDPAGHHPPHARTRVSRRAVGRSDHTSEDATARAITRDVADGSRSPV